MGFFSLHHLHSLQLAEPKISSPQRPRCITKPFRSPFERLLATPEMYPLICSTSSRIETSPAIPDDGGTPNASDNRLHTTDFTPVLQLLASSQVSNLCQHSHLLLINHLRIFSLPDPNLNESTKALCEKVQEGTKSTSDLGPPCSVFSWTGPQPTC